MALTGWMIHAQSATTAPKAEVGDWVTLRINAPGGIKVEVKQTLIAKAEKTGTVKIEQNIGDKAMPAKEITVPLEQLTDPAKMTGKLDKAKVDNLKTGKESIVVKGKKIDCEWKEFKISFDANGKHIETLSKVWTSPEIPLNGMVKMENEAFGNKTSIELVDFGRKK